MIKEDYCSYEVAKLLGEKGFDGEINSLVEEDNTKYDLTLVGFIEADAIPCPTHQMARKWLLQKHELFICIMQTLDVEGNVVYIPTIWKNAMYIGRACKDKNAVFKSNEDAVEMALRYCLTELI